MKTKFKSKLLSILLVLVMVLALVPFASLTAFAASGTGTENDPYVVTTYAELKDLMANAPTDGTVRYIKLGADINENDIQNDHALTLTQEAQNVVLDLAGYKITRNSSITVDKGVIRAKQGILTINDSVGTGGVYAKGDFQATIALTSTDAITNDNGTVIINGGHYENEYSIGNAVYNESAKLYINGGTFKAPSYALYAQAGATYIYGGEYRSDRNDVISLSADQKIEVYNLTAYGNVKTNSAQADLWDYISEDGDVYVNGTRQSKVKAWKFEGNTVRIETEMVDEIWITATAPVVGNYIPTSVDIPYTDDYEIVEEYGKQVVAWMKNGNPTTAEKFEATTEYMLRVYVKVNAPTTMDFSAKVNGQPAELEFVMEAMEGYKLYWVSYTFPATEDNVIPSANVSVTTPVDGGTSTAGIIFTSEKYNASVGWSTTADGSDLNNFNNKTFVAGNTYYADIYLVAEDPYVFADGATVFINGVAYTATWANGASYKKYVAVYDVPFTVPSTETYTVSFNANGGTGTMLDETEQLGGLILPNCTFTAPMGKQFKCWVEGGTGGDQYAAGEEYNVTENVTFYAIWEDIPASEYDVIYKPGDGEGIGDTETVANGTEYTLKAYNNVGIDACDGMTFNYWSIRIGDEESAEIARKQPGEKITVTENTYVVAIWKAAPDHTVTATAGENGSISPSGEVTVAHGANQAFTITANSGYRIKDVKVNGTSVGAVATYIFDDVTENATITVEFEVDTVSHTHDYGTTWKSNENNHWNECACGDKANVAPHADENNDEKCDACAYAMPKAEENDPSAPTPDVPNTNTDMPTDATEIEKDDSTENSTDSEEDDEEPDEPAEKKEGCGSSVAISAFSIVGLLGAALVIKKKEN